MKAEIEAAYARVREAERQRDALIRETYQIGKERRDIVGQDEAPEPKSYWRKRHEATRCYEP